MSDAQRSLNNPCQILSRVYSLNKSYTKKLVIELEYNSIIDERYTPVLRLISNDFTGITFTYEGWQDFKKSFEDIVNYFCGRDSTLKDQKIYGAGLILRFTESHEEKAVELEEDKKLGSAGYGKRFRHSILLKFVTIKCLYRYIQKCIDAQFEYLNSISRSVSVLANEVCEGIENKATLMFASQVVDRLNISHVSYYMNDVSTNMLESLYNIVQTRSKDSNETIISKHVMIDLFYQFVSPLHLSNVLACNYR